MNVKTALDNKYYVMSCFSVVVFFFFFFKFSHVKNMDSCTYLLCVFDSSILVAAGVCVCDLSIENLKVIITCCSLVSHI